MGQSQPGPQGPLGPQGIQGAQGSQGIQGLRGDQGLPSNVVGPMGSQGIQGLQGLASSVAGPKGEAGPSSDVTKVFMKANTLWCADGDVCKLPPGKKSLDWGYGGSKMYDDGNLHIRSDDFILMGAGTGDFDNVELRQNGIFTKSSPGTEWIGLGVDKGSIFRNSDTRVADGGPKTMTIRNDDGNLRLMASTSTIQIPNSTVLQFGEGFEKNSVAGQISYGQQDGGAEGTLNIVGAGKAGLKRVVRVWDTLRIGDSYLRQDDNWLRLVGNKDKVDDYDKGFAARNLWAKDRIFAVNGTRDIIAELDDLRQNTVRK